MKNIIRLSLIMVTILFTGSSLSAQSKYEAMGISMDVPGGWKVTDEEKTDDMAFFSFEKIGSGSEIATFAFVAVDIDMDEYIKIAMKNYEDEVKSAGATSKWTSEITSGTIGKSFSTRQITFTVTDDTGPQNGICYVFKACDKTVLLMSLGQKDEAVKSKGPFATIHNSISCK